MLKKLVLILALIVGAVALTPSTSQAVPFSTATASVAKEGALAEPARYRRYRSYRRSYYRPRYYRPRRYYVRRAYYPRRNFYRRNFY